MKQVKTTFVKGESSALIFQYFKICSPYEKLHNEIMYLKDILKYKRYPNDFVDLFVKTFFDKLCITKKTDKAFEKKPLLIVLLFLGCLSLETRIRFSNTCIRNPIPFCSLRIAFQSITFKNI